MATDWWLGCFYSGRLPVVLCDIRPDCCIPCCAIDSRIQCHHLLLNDGRLILCAALICILLMLLGFQFKLSRKVSRNLSFETLMLSCRWDALLLRDYGDRTLLTQQWKLALIVVRWRASILSGIGSCGWLKLRILIGDSSCGVSVIEVRTIWIIEACDCVFWHLLLRHDLRLRIIGLRGAFKVVW